MCKTKCLECGSDEYDQEYVEDGMCDMCASRCSECEVVDTDVTYHEEYGYLCLNCAYKYDDIG